MEADSDSCGFRFLTSEQPFKISRVWAEFQMWAVCGIHDESEESLPGAFLRELGNIRELDCAPVFAPVIVSG